MGTLVLPEQELFEATRLLYRGLGRGEEPREASTDLRLRWNETCYGDTEFTYARHYGLDVTIESRLYVGLSRQAAERIMLRWRDGSPARVVFTSQRLLRAVDDEWLDFAFDTIAAVEVDLPKWGFTVLFQTAFPMWLSGPFAPAYALVIGHACWGVEFLNHPQFMPFVL